MSTNLRPNVTTETRRKSSLGVSRINNIYTDRTKGHKKPVMLALDVQCNICNEQKSSVDFVSYSRQRLTGVCQECAQNIGYQQHESGVTAQHFTNNSSIQIA